MGLLMRIRTMQMADVAGKWETLPRRWRVAGRMVGLVLLALWTGLLFSRLNPKPDGHFDYQFRIATGFLSGRLGAPETVSWLSEMIPYEGNWYSAFPLGGVLCMLPVAAIRKLQGSTEVPIREVLGVLASLLAVLIFRITGRYGDPIERRAVLTTLILFGTWLTCNVIYGNAWQLSLLMAVTGEFLALHFLLIRRQPVAAGVGFAIAFGNRTELILLAPVLLFLLLRADPFGDGTPGKRPVRVLATDAAAFLLIPFLLGCATLWYNFARFHHPLDFGYTHIPNMMKETWYRNGLFSLHAVPMNLHFLFLASSWELRDQWPYLRPALFGGSILTACPYLVLLFREGGRDPALRKACWLAIGILLVALLTHGNPGGVQYSYRYAITLLPWFLLIWLDQKKGPVTATEALLYALSLLINGWAVFLTHWARVVGMD
ncbi:MAG: hypothetical protein NW241_07865 [Bacteroidia bacterium]|nr:hypothetical protein [Bacteroidia bacterium]